MYITRERRAVVMMPDAALQVAKEEERGGVDRPAVCAAAQP